MTYRFVNFIHNLCFTDRADKIHNLPRYHDDFKRQNRKSWHADASCLGWFCSGVMLHMHTCVVTFISK